jgi:hypothetical protein
MRQHAKRQRLGLELVIAAALCLVALPVFAEGLTVVGYVDLSIERLELAHATWSLEGRSPAETEQAAVCQRYETSLEAYYAFAGEHAKEIGDYLEEYPDKRERIEALAASVRALIEQKEVQ